MTERQELWIVDRFEGDRVVVERVVRRRVERVYFERLEAAKEGAA